MFGTGCIVQVRCLIAKAFPSRQRCLDSPSVRSSTLHMTRFNRYVSSQQSSSGDWKGRWSIAQMKALLLERNILTKDCFQVEDLVDRILKSGGFPDEVNGIPNNKTGHLIRTPLKTPIRWTEKIGPLSCITVQNYKERSVAPEAIVIFAHGFGADNRDVADIADMTFDDSRVSKHSVRFIFPNAPIPIYGEGSRAWWMIEPDRFSKYIMQGKLREICREVPSGLETARQQYLSMIDIIASQTSLPMEKLILAGFSQGSMISCDVALRMESNVGGVALFSTLMICEDEWKKHAKKHSGLHIIQSHGHQDEILPYPTAPWLGETLRPSGIKVDFTPFHGGHSIPDVALDPFYSMIGRISGSR